MSEWDDYARKVVAEVVAGAGELPLDSLRKLLAEKYPFGVRGSARGGYAAWRRAVKAALKGRR